MEESFANLWLIPNTAKFSPDKNITLDIRVQTDPIDFAKEAIDLRLTYGSAYYPGYQEHVLFSDVVIPVCSPTFWNDHHDLEKYLSNVAHEKLIHINWGPAYSSSPTWTAWFRNAGIQSAELGTPDLITNNLSLAVAAARSGLGIALAPSKLVEQDIVAGTLVAASEISFKLAKPYVCIFPDARAENSALRLFLRHLGIKVHPQLSGNISIADNANR